MGLTGPLREARKALNSTSSATLWSATFFWKPGLLAVHLWHGWVSDHVEPLKMCLFFFWFSFGEKNINMTIMTCGWPLCHLDPPPLLRTASKGKSCLQALYHQMELWGADTCRSLSLESLLISLDCSIYRPPELLMMILKEEHSRKLEEALAFSSEQLWFLPLKCCANFCNISCFNRCRTWI